MCFPVLIYNSILNFISIFLTLELSQALSTTDSSKTVNTDKQNAIRGFRVSYKSPPLPNADAPCSIDFDLSSSWTICPTHLWVTKYGDLSSILEVDILCKLELRLMAFRTR
jgi:hypothetical protein